MVETGAVASLDGAAATRPAPRVPGCAPMSPNRFTVACCTFGSGSLRLCSVRYWLHALTLARAQDHCTVPAPNTSAPLGARYRVRWWVPGLTSSLLP